MARPVRVSGRRVQARGLRSVNRQLRASGMSGSAGGALSRRLVEAGEVIAVIARANAAQFSDRIPATVRVGGGRSGVVIRAGGPKGPAAYTAETAARHPLFGNRNYWYQGPVHPFLKPAAEEGAEPAAVIVAETISDWARGFGFR
jgi:hypothetical protein